MTMSQIDPEGRAPGGRINVKVEPSNQIGQGRLGVFVDVNDHFVIADKPPQTGKQLVGLIEGNFDKSIGRSDGIIDHIMSLASGLEV